MIFFEFSLDAKKHLTEELPYEKTFQTELIEGGKYFGQKFRPTFFPSEIIQDPKIHSSIINVRRTFSQFEYTSEQTIGSKHYYF